MARRLRLALILACAALAAPAAADAAGDLHLHGQQPAAEPSGKEALRLARKLRDGRGGDTGRELSVVLRTLAEKLPDLKGAERREAERMLARPTQGQATGADEKTYSVEEDTPHCGAHFCIHYVRTTENAPPMDGSNGPGDPPDYVKTTLSEFENVYNFQNVQMGWAPPRSDGTRGDPDGLSRTDVYLANIGPNGLYGYAAAEPDRGQQWPSYLVMDNDYRDPAFTSRYPGNPLAPLRVTAAHEYNHVLQYGYDALQDTWMFEATATWMEDKVYDDVNDYYGYLGEWARRSTQPLTQFNPPESGDSNAKVYGSAVFNRWIDTRYDQDAIRRAWEVSIETNDFAPAAYDKALRERGTNFFQVFTQFAADTTEWGAANSPFEEGSAFPDVQRSLGGDPLEPQNATGRRSDFARGTLDHTGYALIAVDPSGQDSITAGATLPRGVAGAVAIVGRTGAEKGGSVVTRVKRMPRGGGGRAVLPNARGFSRVTAVIINGDTKVDGYNRRTRDWNWTGDDAAVTLAVNDFTRPTVRKSSPRRNARNFKRTSRIAITFTEPLSGVTRSTVKLVGPGGRTVPAAVLARGRSLKIVPSRKLAAGRRYVVRLSGLITDAGGNRLPTSRRTLRFTTGR